jgi:outer membrane protein TolC
MAGEKDVLLAKQSYKLSWMLDVTYGQREGKNMDGSDRADFLSAMVMFDLPLFTGNRQDKKLAASRLDLNSAQDRREDMKRSLQEMWNKNYARWQKLKSRQQQYQTHLLPKASENARAALFDYQNARSSFNALMRAQILELETRLQALRIAVDSKQVQADLLYLTGEEK